jgi:hypothetical protein
VQVIEVKNTHDYDIQIQVTDQLPRSADDRIKVRINIEIHLGICIALTQPFGVALGAESRIYYLGNTTDRQPQRALRYCYLSRRLRNLKSVFYEASSSMLFSCRCLTVISDKCVIQF